MQKIMQGLRAHRECNLVARNGCAGLSVNISVVRGDQKCRGEADPSQFDPEPTLRRAGYAASGLRCMGGNPLVLGRERDDEQLGVVVTRITAPSESGFPLVSGSGAASKAVTSLREKLIKIGAKVVAHGRYVTFQMAEVAVSGQLFNENPLAHCPVAGATRTSMKRPRIKFDGQEAKARLDEGEAVGSSAREPRLNRRSPTLHIRGCTYCHAAPIGRPSGNAR